MNEGQLDRIRAAGVAAPAEDIKIAGPLAVDLVDCYRDIYAKAKAVVTDARGRSGGSVYMVHAAEFLALRAVVAKTEGWK